MENQVLVIGSTCVDVIIRVDHLPHTGKTCIPTASSSPSAAAPTNAANILGARRRASHVRHPGRPSGRVRRFRQGSTPNVPFAQPVYLPDAANGCCYCLVEAGGERTFLSIHGAEYSFDPAWMARYAAERYAYGYVCGLEIEEKDRRSAGRLSQNRPD